MKKNRLVNHITLRVRNLEKSKEFYRVLAETLGHTIAQEEKDHFYVDGLLVTQNPEASGSVYMSFEAPNPMLVKMFHESALQTGCECLAAPDYTCGQSSEYRAIVLDPDGNNVEVSYKSKRISN